MHEITLPIDLKPTNEESLQKILDVRMEEKEEKEIDWKTKELYEVMGKLPLELKEEAIKKINRLRKYGLNETSLMIEAAVMAKEIREQYCDKRFEPGMLNKSIAKIKVEQMVDNLFRDGKKSKAGLKMEDLKRVARVSIDLNGLKAVNDLTHNHENGDRFLRLAASALRQENIEQFLKEKFGDKKEDVKFYVTADGGDEFALIIKTKKEITKEILDKLMEVINNNLAENKEAEEILDFNNETVLRSFSGITKEDWAGKNDKEKKNILKKAKEQIPSEFKFRATASMGAATLYESFENFKIKDGDNYERILEKLMGGLFAQSDKKSQENKEMYKKELRKSDNREDNFLSEIYSRTEAERDLVRENAELKKAIKELEVSYTKCMDRHEAVKRSVD
jgi:GGDEF domain-containing protein